MAPLPVNNTGRLFVDYIANGRQHTAQFRYGGSGEPPASFLEDVDAIIAAAGPFMPLDWTFVESRYVPSGGTFSLPAEYVPEDMTGTIAVSAAEAPAFVSAIGRSLGGRRVRVYFLGAGYSPAGNEGNASDYRVTTTESAPALALVEALAASELVGIDGFNVGWKSYLNLGYNGYWQREVRP